MNVTVFLRAPRAVFARAFAATAGASHATHRPALRATWHQDATTGRLVCRWSRDGAGEAEEPLSLLPLLRHAA